MQFPAVEVKTQYVRFQGGIDRETPVLSIDPGALLDGMNVQPGLFGGYQRIDAFERYDGRVLPSDATYYYCECTFLTQNVARVGRSITGATSGATAVIAAMDMPVPYYDRAGSLTLTKVSGTFVAGENFTINYGWTPPFPLMMTGATVTAGVFEDNDGFPVVPTVRAHSAAEDDAIALNAAADIYRTDVDKVPGSGDVRGVWVYDGVVYAFRNNAAGTETLMWKSSATGWQPVTFGEEVSFTAGTDTVLDGDTLTQGTATATIARVVQTTTGASPARVGRLILTNRTGNFYAGAATTSSGGALTLSGASTQITLLPGGRYQFDNYNFSGSTDTFNMYGCDGVNRAFEFDGTTYVPISTGMTTDTPSFIKAHKNQLFLSFRGSSQNSGVGFPYIWTTVTGASEIGAGDTITGYATLPGESLAIASRNSLRNLSGSTIDDFLLKTISDERGCIPYTMQTVGNGFCMDDAGVVRITPTQNYGDFSENIVSRRVQPLIDNLQETATASVVYRHRNQYRVFSDDGSGLIMATSTDGKGRTAFQFTEFDYNAGRTSDLINVTCACSGEDATGKDVVFFGADNGYVYQCEKGTSFDGNAIEHYVRLPFGDAKSPRVKKQYRKVVMEMKADGFTTLNFRPEFSYGANRIADHTLGTQDIDGTGGYWGSLVWDNFIYDGQIVATPEFKIGGSGTNMSLFFYGTSDYHASHTLTGAIIHYTPRRLER